MKKMPRGCNSYPSFECTYYMYVCVQSQAVPHDTLQNTLFWMTNADINYFRRIIIKKPLTITSLGFERAPRRIYKQKKEVL